MVDNYKIEDLLIGNLSNIINIGGMTGPINNISGPFLFVKVSSEEGKKQRYKEVFTEEEYKLSNKNDYLEKQKFGKTYVVKDDNFNILNYLTEEEKLNGYVSKFRVLEIYNTVRDDKTKREETERQLEKAYSKIHK